MDRPRRALLLGGTLTFLAPSRLYAQPDLGREHRPMIDSPTLAEDPSAVPLQVSVNHPMEPEHFIRVDRNPPLVPDHSDARMVLRAFVFEFDTLQRTPSAQPAWHD
jgi:hypothetical protein